MLQSNPPFFRLAALFSLALLVLGGCPTGEPGPGDDDDDAHGHGDLLGIGLAPNDPRMAPGDTVQFQAKAFYDDYTSEDITEAVAWVSTDDRIATVGNSGGDKGACQAHEAGEASIIATYEGGISSKVTLTVTGATVESVEIRPSGLELHVGDGAQFEAIASYSDGGSGNVAGSCSWSVDPSSVASVDGTGWVAALAEGQATVDAQCGGAPVTAASLTVVDEGTTLPDPDLRITDLAATVQGDQVDYLATVRNDGDGYAAGFYVDLFLDPGAAPQYGDSWDQYAWVTGLGGGESTTVSLQLSDVAAGSYQSYALADSEQMVVEGNEDNNVGGPESVTVASGQADLVIDLFDGVTDGSYTLYEVHVTNVGGTAAGAFWIDLFFDQLSAPSIGDYGDDWENVAGLDPGDTTVWEVEVEDGPVSYWDSWVLVDSADDVAESDEGDNTAYLELWP